MKILFSNGRRIKRVDFFLTGEEFFGNWGGILGVTREKIFVFCVEKFSMSIANKE